MHSFQSTVEKVLGEADPGVNMGLLAFLVLVVAIGLLWRRVRSLEHALAEIRGAIAAAEPSPPPHLTEARAPEPSPASDATAAAPAEIGSPEVRPVASAGTLAFVDFEDLFGRRLPIWAGGVALAAAGFFLVRWSIDQGLLTPVVRVALAGVFGLALLAGAETAYRWRARVADPRVAQALAGAGLATLYAAFYLAGTTYGLIGSTFAFLGLACVTAAALALSYRFGLPSALLGLVGGFAAPALVGVEAPELSLLTLYLALVTGGLAYTGRRQGRSWLGFAALAGGLGWGMVLLVGAAPGVPAAWALGLFLVLLGAVIPASIGEASGVERPARIAAAGVAALQLAALVRLGGFGPLEWGLYLLLGAALAWFGWRTPAMREANAVAAAVGVALLAFWPGPAPLGFAAVAASLAAVFAGVPIARIERGRGSPIDIIQASGVALGLAAVTVGSFGSILPDAPSPVLAAALLALASLPTGAVFLSGRAGPDDGGFARHAAQAVAALLAVGAAAQVVPQDGLAWLAGGGAALLAWRRGSAIGAIAMLAALAAAFAVHPLAQWLEAGFPALAGRPMQVANLPDLRETALHVAPAAVAGIGLAARLRSARTPIAAGAAVLAAIMLHVAFRHAFAAAAGNDFVGTGVLQRAAWEALLFALAVAAWTRGLPRIALALALAGIAHFAWFALTLHNPLWSLQAVGPWPIANALLPAYGVGLAGLWLARGRLPTQPIYWRWGIDGATMLAAALFALSQLRQAFSGTLLTATPISQGEDLLRSLLGIVLAAGFLWWGARSGERSWRIGSLALMLVAVLKVFLVDAAGLSGLVRIASFMALGFSLIAIGWFYTRELRRPEKDAAA